MLIAQWILEITDILMYKFVSFLYVSVIQKNVLPPNLKTVPTALLRLPSTHDADVLAISCIVRLSTIPSVKIFKIGGKCRPP